MQMVVEFANCPKFVASLVRLIAGPIEEILVQFFVEVFARGNYTVPEMIHDPLVREFQGSPVFLSASNYHRTH
jgi:hypothetical protein